MNNGLDFDLNSKTITGEELLEKLCAQAASVETVDASDPFLAAMLGLSPSSNFPVETRKPIDAACHLTQGRKPCHKCGGRGVIESFRHIKGGECFKCEGTGNADHFSTSRVMHAGDMVDVF